MAAVGAFLAKPLLDWITGAAAATQPTNRWIGLAAGTPTSVSGSELANAQGYFSRLTALFGAANSPAGSCSNTAAMTFGPFSSTGSAVGVQMWDGSPIASSNMLLYGTLQTTRTYGVGDSLVMNAGALTLVMT